MPRSTRPSELEKRSVLAIQRREYGHALFDLSMVPPAMGAEYTAVLAARIAHVVVHEIPEFEVPLNEVAEEFLNASSVRRPGSDDQVSSLDILARNLNLSSHPEIVLCMAVARAMISEDSIARRDFVSGQRFANMDLKKVEAAKQVVPEAFARLRKMIDDLSIIGKHAHPSAWVRFQAHYIQEAMLPELDAAARNIDSALGTAANGRRRSPYDRRADAKVLAVTSLRIMRNSEREAEAINELMNMKVLDVRSKQTRVAQARGFLDRTLRNLKGEARGAVIELKKLYVSQQRTRHANEANGELDGHEEFQRMDPRDQLQALADFVLEDPAEARKIHDDLVRQLSDGNH
jgi:hypothetical protein